MIDAATAGLWLMRFAGPALLVLMIAILIDLLSNLPPSGGRPHAV